jgi:peroxiredoxin Q/BCP
VLPWAAATVPIALQEVAMLNVGDPAPGFTARAHTGERVKLGDFADKKVILWFYPEADTPG